MKKLILMFSAIAASSAPAQTPDATPTKTPPTTAAATGVADSVVRDTPMVERHWRPLRFSVLSAGVYDSNIGREEEDIVASNGFVYGAGIKLQPTRERPRYTATYEVAQHAYTHNDEFDRVSHHFNAVFSQILSDAFLLETIADIGIRGSSEDRDVGNQYILLPRLNYRVSSSQRLRLYGAYRLRRYDTDSDRNANNRYVGIEFRDEADDDAEWEVGFRYEKNSARSERRSYTRRTYHTGYTREIGERSIFFAELKYRSQRYDSRLIEVENEEVPRLDHRLSPTVEWSYYLGKGLSLIANYDYEDRTSNNPGSGYRDHVFTLTGRFDW